MNISFSQKLIISWAHYLSYKYIVPKRLSSQSNKIYEIEKGTSNIPILIKNLEVQHMLLFNKPNLLSFS